MIHIYKFPSFIKRLAKNLVWDIPTGKKEIYLTFDDGPVPGLTEYVLKELRKYDAKATFFCVGDNISKYPEICKKIVEQGHLIGNHTFNHLKGWSTKNHEYFMNIDQCRDEIQKHQKTQGKPLFRPPYGQISKKQIKSIKDRYHIIMWDVLTYDYEKTLAPPRRLEKIIDKTGPGTITVFHDNIKGEKNLKFLLPKYLDHFKKQGYQFKKIEIE